MPVLESYRGRDIVGVEELTAVANSLIEHYGRQSEQAAPRSTINARTVRQYLAESLLGEPTGQTSASTVFNYGNLLRLLAVRKLLADHWSVVKVREFMRTLDITALEEMVNAALASARLQPNESAGHESAKALRSTEPLSADEEQESSSTLYAVERARRQERELGEWIEIAPGLEIKVRRSFRPPASEEDRARLAMRFWSVIMKEE